jgi:hypothetical protein
VIWGLTSTPITLTHEWAQTYRPEHHNFSEHFLFEPALDPGVTAQQRAELTAAGIRAIHAYDGFLAYYDDEAWNGPCLGCTGFDGDHDGRCTGDPTFDCDDGDPTVWTPPGEVLGLAFTDDASVSWGPPPEPGATAVVFDLLRSPDPADFVTPALCVETNGADLGAADPAVPAAGAVHHYLVRAENACPAGQGSLGQASDGSERAGRACP